ELRPVQRNAHYAAPCVLQIHVGQHRKARAEGAPMRLAYLSPLRLGNLEGWRVVHAVANEDATVARFPDGCAHRLFRHEPPLRLASERAQFRSAEASRQACKRHHRQYATTQQAEPGGVAVCRREHALRGYGAVASFDDKLSIPA